MHTECARQHNNKLPVVCDVKQVHLSVKHMIWHLPLCAIMSFHSNVCLGSQLLMLCLQATAPSKQATRQSAGS